MYQQSLITLTEWYAYILLWCCHYQCYHILIVKSVCTKVFTIVYIHCANTKWHGFCLKISLSSILCQPILFLYIIVTSQGYCVALTHWKLVFKQLIHSYVWENIKTLITDPLWEKSTSNQCILHTKGQKSETLLLLWMSSFIVLKQPSNLQSLAVSHLMPCCADGPSCLTRWLWNPTRLTGAHQQHPTKRHNDKSPIL